ncbi:unnamed protein product [Schistosoma margrebowiei]|uniref:Uncharacterized protein n=1 Tax=Schistosoma margrebowiei TaxID=48269 RepID=A0A183N0M8_9TREM|nr:unnamed protein product [Schistosoma margrebowiei]
MSTEAVFLKPRAPFKQAVFNVRTLMQVRQQIGLAMSLESLNIDVCCLSETRIQDSGEVLQIRSPSVASKSFFYVRLSGNPVASSSGLAGVALSARAEAALVDWIPINSRLCAVRLESSFKVRNRREKRCLASVGPSRLRGWGLRDGATQWLETLSDMAQNGSQWRSCCNLLLLSS